MPARAKTKMEAKPKRGRPKCVRRTGTPPGVNYFKPRGIPLTELDTVKLKVEELEAMKLLYQDKMEREQAAKEMGVSRRTMERELKSGLSKVVDALVNGKAIEIKGGYYLADGETFFKCLNKHEWKADKSISKPRECPECSSDKIRKVNPR